MTGWMRMMRPIAAVGLATGMAGCAMVMPGPETQGVMAGIEDTDACGASRFQDLVGTSVGELDSSILPEDRRVIFPGMMVTQDYRVERLNVEVGEDDRITRIYCG